MDHCYANHYITNFTIYVNTCGLLIIMHIIILFTDATSCGKFV